MIIKITEITEIFCMLMYALFLVLSGMFLAGVFATFLFEVLPDKLQDWYKQELPKKFFTRLWNTCKEFLERSYR